MSKWLKESKSGMLSKALLFMVFPILSFLYSLKRMNTRSSYIVFFLTGVLFGLSFTVDSGKDNGVGLDGQYYRHTFENYQYVSNIEFRQKFIEYIHFDSNIKDFYFEGLSYLISRFTDNYHIMFAIVAIIFSYFSLKSLRFLTKEPEFRLSFTTYVLTYYFLLNSIFNINGFRFWTAAWIAVYSIFQIYRNSNKRYILLAITTPFIHGSYFVFIIILFLSMISRRFERTWISLLIVSFLFSEFAIQSVEFLSKNFEAYLPTFVSNLVRSYTDDSLISGGGEASGFAWVTTTFSILTRLYFYLLVYLLVKNRKIINSDLRTKDIYQFLLVWIACFNFLSPIPSLGGRFLAISYPFVAYIALLHIKKAKLEKVIVVLPIVYSFHALNQILLYLSVLELPFYFSNPFFLIYKYVIHV